MQKPDHRHRRLLGARRQRPRGGTAENGNELASSHSITSSARASSIGGTSRPEGLGRFEVEDKLELGRLLNWKIGWLGALKYLVNIRRGSTVKVGETCPIGDQPTVCCK